MAINPPYSLPTNVISSLNWIQGGPTCISGTGAGAGAHQYPNGTITTICFTDAKGQNWALDVDQRYAQILMQISQAHQMMAQQYAYAPATTTKVYNKPQVPPPIMVKPAPMIEGDFTEDEMELAENLIAELEGGDKKGPRQNIQEDISCEA